MSELKHPGREAHTVSLSQINLSGQLPPHLREHVRRLQQIASVLHVCTIALRQQQGESDDDIASVIDLNATAALEQEIDLLDELLDTFELQRIHCEEKSEAA